MATYTQSITGKLKGRNNNNDNNQLPFFTTSPSITD